MANNHREISKMVYRIRGDKPTIEEINCGSLQRLADAAELMATNFLRLQSDVEYLTKRNKILKENLEHEKKRISAYKGQITKLKKKENER